MGSITTQLGNPPAEKEKDAGLPQLLTVTQLCDVLKVSPSWIYQRKMESCREPLPVVRFGPRSLRFDLEQVFHYVHQHERHWAGARLESSDGSAPINGKGHFKWHKSDSRPAASGYVRMYDHPTGGFLSRGHHH
jgi:hypothetical protein